MARIQQTYPLYKTRPAGQSRWLSAVVLALPVIGILFPTSVDQNISKVLYFEAIAVALILVSAMLFRRGGCGSSVAVQNALAIHAVLFFSTLISPYAIYAFGASGGYLVLSLIYCLDLNGLIVRRSADLVLLLINFLFIGGASAIMLDYRPVTLLLLNYYSAFYDSLMPMMLETHRPVLTLASHSIAGFYFMLLLYLNVRRAAIGNGSMFLGFAMFYVPIMFLLKSQTGYIYGSIGFLFIALAPANSSLIRSFLRVTLCLVVATLFVLNVELRNAFWSQLQGAFTFVGGGLQGRYFANGDLAGNLEYIKNHPFLPVGYTLENNLFFGDSGFVEYTLRGSILLLICIFTGLWMFFRNNCLLRRHAIELFILFCSFEVAYSHLLYLRNFYMMPFVVVYLNGLYPSTTPKVRRIFRPADQRVDLAPMSV